MFSTTQRRCESVCKFVNSWRKSMACIELFLLIVNIVCQTLVEGGCATGNIKETLAILWEVAVPPSLLMPQVSSLLQPKRVAVRMPRTK